MREIKFRAWDKVNKRMLEVHSLAPDHWVQYEPILEDGEPSMKWEDVEIMQFTGIKDKNGKEIYEGDILFTPEQQITIGLNAAQVKTPVFWNEKEARFDWLMRNENIEVIGNIYEQGHLLN